MTDGMGGPRKPRASSAAEKKSGDSKVQRSRALPPNAGRGRKKGVPNKLTSDEKALIAKLVNYGLERAQAWLERVARKSPARALTITAKFAEHIVPKLRGVEVSGPEGAPLPAPSFAFTMARGGPGTSSSVEVSSDSGAGAGDGPPAALPAPIAAEAPELPRPQLEAPAPRQEPEPAHIARTVRAADPDDFADPATIAAADAYERNAHARRPQAMPPPAVADLVRERRARRAAKERGEAIEASFEVIPPPADPPPASGTSLASWAQLGRDDEPRQR